MLVTRFAAIHCLCRSFHLQVVNASFSDFGLQALHLQQCRGHSVGSRFKHEQELPASSASPGIASLQSPVRHCFGNWKADGDSACSKQLTKSCSLRPSNKVFFKKNMNLAVRRLFRSRQE